MVGQDCVELNTQVTARYGNRYRNIDGPRARVERFGFVEWGYPSADMETEMSFVHASRALTEEQANAIADSLRGDPDFADVSVVARPFSKFAAGEGMRSGGSVVFAQATDERQQLLGFPHFLSVWPDES